MSTAQSLEKIRLRPHHIYCAQSSAAFPDRGETFASVEGKIKHILHTSVGTSVEVIEGVDELCMVCPLCQDDRCQSAEGNEDEVRKWDAIILRELGISYGDTIAVEKFRALIGSKTPLAFCRNRCKMREVCGVLT